MNYTAAMNFEWDEAKSDLCFRERGFDSAYAAQVFFDPDRMVQADTRYSYGEERYRVVGVIEQRLFVVVYTPRHDAMRIISARKANQREVSSTLSDSYSPSCDLCLSCGRMSYVVIVQSIHGVVNDNVNSNTSIAYQRWSLRH